MNNAESHNPLLSRLEELNAIGIALSSERDINRLLETILVAAMRITTPPNQPLPSTASINRFNQPRK